MTTQPLFDTLAAAEDLEAAGFESKQAKAIVLVVDKSLTGGVATKADIAEVKAELKADIALAKTACPRSTGRVCAPSIPGSRNAAPAKAIERGTIQLGGLMIALAAALKFFPGGNSF